MSRRIFSQPRVHLRGLVCVLGLGGAAHAVPVPAIAFSDGKVLDVQGVIGTGSNSAYEVVDFNDGTDLAWQYNFNGSLDGYTMLQAVEAASSLEEVSTYYPQYNSHFISYLTDGTNTTDEYPALYFSPPAAGDPTGTSAQGIVFDQAQSGVDELSITNGEIVAWDNSYTDVPTLPETAVPEPAACALAAAGLLVLRRRRTPSR